MKLYLNTSEDQKIHTTFNNQTLKDTVGTSIRNDLKDYLNSEEIKDLNKASHTNKTSN